MPPTNETVAQVFARLSAYRDSMDGPQVRIGSQCASSCAQLATALVNVEYWNRVCMQAEHATSLIRRLKAATEHFCKHD